MMMIAPFGMLVALAVVGLLVAGVVTLLVASRGRALGWVLAILALLAVPAALLLFYRFAAVPRMMPMGMGDDRARNGLVAVEQEPDDLTAVLPSPLAAGEDMSAFLADVYPSAEQAVRATARDAARSVSSVSGALPAPPPVRVSGQGVPAAMLQAAAAALAEAGALIGRVEVETSGPEAPASRPANDARLTCDVHVESGLQGFVRVVLRGPAGEVARSAEVRATPWMADFGHFAASRGQRRILAQSRRPCTSLEDAQRAALDDAAGQLLPAFQMATSEYMIARHRPLSELPGGAGGLRRILTSELERDNSMILERFPQRFVRPYGEIWRQTLLVDAYQGTLNGKAQRVCDQTIAVQGARASSWGHLGMSIGGLAVLILAVYLVLNAATRGYYSLVLRLAAVALAVAGTIVVMCMS